MRFLRTRDVDPDTWPSLLERPALEEIQVSPAVSAKTEAVFGAPLTPDEAVQQIIEDVRRQGDAAVIDYTRRIDGIDLSSAGFFVSDDEIQRAYRSADPAVVEAIEKAKVNIGRYHARQTRESWFATEPGGVILGQKVTPIERVACYVPGGSAPLVSTALMSVIPAKVAGVETVILATPCSRDGSVDPHLLVAAKEAGADRILRVGGAQAIAALAYGTETVPKVHKIVGPGNIFVALAKKRVFGRVGIESLAGPSEILVVADDTADPAWVAADLLSQSEHDPEAAAILVTPSAALARSVEAEVDRQASGLAREDIVRRSLERWGTIVLVESVAEAIDIVNLCAPEHLELIVEAPSQWLHGIKHAGAIFLGPVSSEPIGDYIAGPNHVLPTNGTARFGSPLSVDDFVKRSSVISYSFAAAKAYGPYAVRLARAEGLEAHARAVEARLTDDEEEREDA